MKKKYIILSIILIIIVVGVIKFIVDLNEEKKMSEAAISKINSCYDNLVNDINKYNDHRDKINISLSSYYQEEFAKEYENIYNLFNEYDNTISSIDDNTKKIDENCGNRVFKDSNVNNICSKYKVSYEEMINIYVTDINKFNEIVNTYNKETSSNLSLFKSKVINDYIDYDEDGEYRGLEANEEN